MKEKAEETEGKYLTAASPVGSRFCSALVGESAESAVPAPIVEEESMETSTPSAEPETSDQGSKVRKD